MNKFFSSQTPSKWFCENPVYVIDGVEATYWIFEKMSGKSLNLFGDGTISKHYLLTDAPQQQQSCNN